MAIGASASRRTTDARNPAARSRDARQDARLLARYRQTRDPDLRAELLERFMPLATHLAGRYAHHNEQDDLAQIAGLALLKAIDRYDPGRGLAFSSFAVPTILGELKRYFRDHGWFVRVPRVLHDRSLRVRRAADQLSAELGRSPTPGEIADLVGTTTELVLEALQVETAHHPDRLDAPTGDDEDGPGLVVAFEESGYTQAEAAATLSPLLDQLPARDRTVLRLRFEDDLTQSEIGELLGISQMQVSRILSAAIARMQELADGDTS